jgi:hypothetical protein
MPAWPDAPRVAAFLSRARRRLAWLAAARGAAAGSLAAAIVAAAIWIAGAEATIAVGVGVVAVSAGAAVALMRERRRAGVVAHRVEARVPACRNVLVTAQEILARPDGVRPYIGARVCRDAARAIDAIDLGTIFPARRPIAALATTLAMAVLASGAALARAPVPAGLAPPSIGTDAAIERLAIVVTPPDYASQPPERFDDPERLTALAGSRIDVVVHGRADRGWIETADGRSAMSAAASGGLTGTVVVRQDGFLAIDAQRDSGADARRLIGVRVTPDAAPGVRITRPGRDLLFDDGRQTLSLEVAADDDLALASLRVVYTKVTGSGENFTFVDGDVPLAIARASERAWTARASWPLAPLALAPGDMVVYRAHARDRRPGAPAAESDAYIVEILAPGSVASEGFAIDDQRDRYAISQQMVILKTERLIGRRGSLGADALLEDAQLIAAEQRQVRAEFVFMMGGHIEDEEVEAAGEHEIAAGRLVNRGRVDLVQAITAMSEAAASLTGGDLTEGLAREREALAALQRAFTRSRYILRTLSERERIDVARRLTGELAGLARDARGAPPAVPAPRADALRRMLDGTAAMLDRTDLGPADAAGIDAFAADLLRLDAASDTWRAIAATLDRGAAALRARDPATARAELSDAAARLAGALRAELAAADARAAGAPARSAVDRLIDGALADAFRRGGGR